MIMNTYIGINNDIITYIVINDDIINSNRVGAGAETGSLIISCALWFDFLAVISFALRVDFLAVDIAVLHQAPLRTGTACTSSCNKYFNINLNQTPDKTYSW